MSVLVTVNVRPCLWAYECVRTVYTCLYLGQRLYRKCLEHGIQSPVPFC